MSTPDSTGTAAEQPARRGPVMLTWRAPEAPRMESVRVQLSGDRLRATGRIVAAGCPEHEPFSASYDLVTDERGATRRLTLSTTAAAGERHVSVSRDREGNWLIGDGQHSTRSHFGGAVDVDVQFSALFATLAIRRQALSRAADERQVAVVFVALPDLSAEQVGITYSSGPEGVNVVSPAASSTVSVDADGFVLDYPGLARRV